MEIADSELSHVLAQFCQQRAFCCKKMEATKMLNWEYDADTERRVIREEGYQEGYQIGYQKGYLMALSEVRFSEYAGTFIELLKEGLSPKDAFERVKSFSENT
jgi:flagellar biosynthesis/type III secretory pathway protein FliH